MARWIGLRGETRGRMHMCLHMCLSPITAHVPVPNCGRAERTGDRHQAASL